MKEFKSLNKYQIINSSNKTMYIIIIKIANEFINKDYDSQDYDENMNEIFGEQYYEKQDDNQSSIDGLIFFFIFN